MPSVDWSIEAVSFGNCNCDWCCPCQFESRPTEGNCRGFEAFRIERGHFGDVPLEGLKAVILYAWPGAIFEGNGEMLAVIDENADARQREALATVLYGGETEEAKTHWWVFHAMSSKVHEPQFKPIELEVDIEGRTGRVRVPGLLEATGQPIKSPATGEEHRVRIDIPDGIEFELAEIGMASSKSPGPIPLDLSDSYGQFNVIRHSGTGVVHGR
jgi:hypothetical protein